MMYKPRSLSPKERAELEGLRRELATEKQRNDDLESALVELGTLFAEQDDAIVEIGELITEQEE